MLGHVTSEGSQLPLDPVRGRQYECRRAPIGQVGEGKDWYQTPKAVSCRNTFLFPNQPPFLVTLNALPIPRSLLLRSLQDMLLLAHRPQED